MTYILVTNRKGDTCEVSAQTGRSVMELIRNAGDDDLLALCGGCMSCATCHVYIDHSDLDRLSPMSNDENDLLDASAHRTEMSRLSCQIFFTEAINGIHVTIAPED